MSKYGYIDKSGKFIIPPQFDDCYDYSEGVASVEVDGKSGFIDKQGDFVIPLQFEYVEDFSEGLAAVSIDGKYGYIFTFTRIWSRNTLMGVIFNDDGEACKIRERCFSIPASST